MWYLRSNSKTTNSFTSSIWRALVLLICGLMLNHSWATGVGASHTNYTLVLPNRAGLAHELQTWRDRGQIAWFVEFGTEVLLQTGDANIAQRMLGHTPASKSRSAYVIEQSTKQFGPEQLLVQSLACSSLAADHHGEQSVWATVGGYDVIRFPDSGQALLASLQNKTLQAVPSSGKVAELWLPAPKSLPTPKLNVRQFVNKVDPERWYQTVSQLANYNRNSYSAGLLSARDWIRQQFVTAGLSPSDFQFQLANITSCAPTPAAVNLPNIIGSKTGLALPNEWIVVGAHYDSRNSNRCDGTLNPQPGANDNASGCAGVIELARIFADVATDRSLLFMCFSGEEQGLVGSRAYVNQLSSSGDLAKVKLMLNLDMIGHDVDGSLPARIESTSQSVISEFANAASVYAPELRIITSSTPNAGSDHYWFQQAGVPAVVTWENGASAYPHYHQSTDLPQNMNRARELAGGILKMDAAVLYARALVVDTGEFADGFE